MRTLLMILLWCNAIWAVIWAAVAVAANGPRRDLRGMAVALALTFVLDAIALAALRGGL